VLPLVSTNLGRREQSVKQLLVIGTITHSDDWQIAPQSHPQDAISYGS